MTPAATPTVTPAATPAVTPAATPAATQAATPTETDGTGDQLQVVPTHLAVPGARELLLDLPHPCPTYPGLTYDGLAVAGSSANPADNQHFIVVTMRPPGKKAPIRIHLGPDPAMVARRGLILVAALRTHGGTFDEPEFGAGVLTWLAMCWTETTAPFHRSTPSGAPVAAAVVLTGGEDS